MRLVVICFVLFQVMVIAQPKPSLNNFAWLEGRWSGAKEGRLNEEWFSAAKGGSISVMFRMTSQDKTMIVQLGTITEDQEGIVLRTRSFGPRLQPYGEDPLELEIARAHRPDGGVHKPKEHQTEENFVHPRRAGRTASSIGDHPGRRQRRSS